jgi:hypothetical protein
VPLFVLMFSLGLGSPFTLFIVMIQRCCHLRGTGPLDLDLDLVLVMYMYMLYII